MIYDYVCTTPGIVRLFLILSQFSVWLSLALVLKFFCTEECIGGTFFNVRIAYLIFSTGGFLLSCIIYVMGICRALPSAIFIIVTDFAFLISMVILAVIAAIQETIFGSNEVLNSIVLNQGAYAAAAAFGFITAILYAVDGFYHSCKMAELNDQRDVEKNIRTRNIRTNLTRNNSNTNTNNTESIENNRETTNNADRI